MLSKLAKLDYVLLVAILLGLRALVEVNIGQSIVALCFIGAVCYSRYLDAVRTPDPSLEIKKQLEEMQSKVSGLYVKNAAKPIPEGKRFF